MFVILLLAGLAILAGVVLAALGWAGEMASFPGDCQPFGLDEVTAADVALLRPPMALWGYQIQATEEALQVIAQTVTARDAEIAALRRELDGLRGPTAAGQGPAGQGWGGQAPEEPEWAEPRPGLRGVRGARGMPGEAGSTEPGWPGGGAGGGAHA